MRGSVGRATLVLAFLATCLLASWVVDAVVNPGRRYDNAAPMEEAQRQRLFHERHGAWPDPKWLANERAGYSRRMAERTAEVMAIKDSQQRWDAWMFLAQARVVPRFTENLFEVVRVPEAVYARMHKRLHETLHTAGPELPEDPGKAWRGDVEFIQLREFNYGVQLELLPIFSEWAGVPVEDTVNNGARVYREGSTLIDHLDNMDLNVISGILHIDSSLDEPFPLQIEDADGVLATVDLKPGEMLLYESAKCFHQRRVPMKGRYYASVFLHYRPVGWNMTRVDNAMPAIPPWWNHGASAPAETSQGTPIRVTFHNTHTRDVELNWVAPGKKEDGAPEMEAIAIIPAGGSSVQHTWEGHSFIAVDPEDRSKRENVFMHPHHDKADVAIGRSWVHDEL